jgi:alpha-D-xyloside xylohydrolase
MGQQRIGANTWSGDTQSTWEDYRKQIPLCLNFTLTGSPHVNADIGGFFPGAYNKRGQAQTCSTNPGFQELYVRWLQFGLFTPMMRSHGETSRREIWEFGKKGEPIYDAIEKAIKTRYALMPYIYSTSWQVSANDDSFMRALVMDYAADKNVWDMNDEFMFGRSLLVAPVTEAMYMPEARGWYEESPDWTQKKEMEVYLPAGNKWYDFETNKVYGGGQNVTVDASIDHCPVFVREGSILPIGPDVQYTSEKPWDDLLICVYAGPKGNFTLYEDEGDNYNYENGVYSTIDFTLKGRKLTIGARKGSYPGMLQNRTFRIMYIDGDNVKGQTVNYSGKAVTVNL